MVETLNISERGAGGKVVQILGGVVSDNNVFTALSSRSAWPRASAQRPSCFRPPAVVGSTESRRVLSADPTVREAMNYYDKIDLAFIVLGGVHVPKNVQSSTSTMTFSNEERSELAKLGAVGNICMRFIDAQGKPVRSPLMNRVMGIDLVSLRKAKRVVGIAGGVSKAAEIHSALAGGWINILITDRSAAERLLSMP